MAQKDAAINLSTAFDYGGTAQPAAVQTEIRSTDTEYGRLVYPVRVDPESNVGENSAIAPPADNSTVDPLSTFSSAMMASLPIVQPRAYSGPVSVGPDTVLMTTGGVPQQRVMAAPVAQPVAQTMYTQPVVQAAYAQPVAQPVTMVQPGAVAQTVAQPVAQTAYAPPVAQPVNLVQPAAMTAYQPSGVQTMVAPGMVKRVETDRPDPLQPETIIGKYEPIFDEPILEVDGLESYRNNGYGTIEIHYVKQSVEGDYIYQTIFVTISGPTVSPMGDKVNLNVTIDSNCLDTIVLERDHRGDTWHQAAIREKVTAKEKVLEFAKLLSQARTPGQQAPAGKLNLKLSDLHFPYKINCAIAGIMTTGIRRTVHSREINVATQARPVLSAVNPAFIGMNPAAIPPGYTLVPTNTTVPVGYTAAQPGIAGAQTAVYPAVGAAGVVYRQ